MFPGVKGGEKPDRRGGAKIDHFWRREGLICLDRQGWLERRPAPPFLGGAFRPERKAPLPIAATCGVESTPDLGSTGRLGGPVPFAFF